MILECRRCTEDSHDGIACELLHCSAGASDLVGHRVVEPLQADPDALWVVPGCERGRADEVGKQHRGQLSFATSDRISRHSLIVTPRPARVDPSRESSIPAGTRGSLSRNLGCVARWP
jgi:hypothetical protein